jgi:hypothetical protein
MIFQAVTLTLCQSSDLLYDCRFTTSHFVFALLTLESHDQRFLFQLNPWGHSPYVTSSLTRGWVCVWLICFSLPSVHIAHITCYWEFFRLQYTVFRLIVVLFCVMCVVCVLCLIVLPLPPGENPFAPKINNKNNNNIQVLCKYKADPVYLTYLMLQRQLNHLWTVVSLTTAKFKPLIFSVSGFALSYTANMFIPMILYDFGLLSA